MRALLVLLCVIAACSSPKTLRGLAREHARQMDESIRENIDDPERLEAMQGVQNRVQKCVDRFFDDLEVAQDKLGALNRDHGATRAQFRALQSQMAEARSSTTTKLIRLAMEARSVATREDWAAITKNVGK